LIAVDLGENFLLRCCEPAIMLYSVNVEYCHYKLGREQEAVPGCGGLASRQEVLGEINGSHFVQM